MVVNCGNGTAAIRKGPWKYIEGVPAKEGSKIEEPQLYNLEDDISESENRIRDFRNIQITFI